MTASLGTPLERCKDSRGKTIFVGDKVMVRGHFECALWTVSEIVKFHSKFKPISVRLRGKNGDGGYKQPNEIEKIEDHTS